MYDIIPITRDYFRVIKRDENGFALSDYFVDTAVNNCKCLDFQTKPKEKKKRYKCQHLQMCAGLKS